MTRGACGGCEYSEPVLDPEGMLRCRRHAPRPAPGGVEPTEISWPIVAPEDWCGEFLERDSMDETEEEQNLFSSPGASVGVP